ncbi:MAG: hypothetical protein ACI3ZW_00580 [Parabacteroides sp.]
MENVNITLTEEKQCPLSARNATGPVTVKLEGNNKLETTNTSSDQCPALWAPVTTGVELIIMEGEAEGSLTAKGAQDAPGIGSKGTQGSQITIKSGKITATGGNMGAGIGGGYMGAGGTITITGSSTKVTANGGDKSDAAGIGCGKAGDGGTITITGGTVTATNGNNTGTGIPDIKGNTVVVGPDANVGAGCDAPLDCSYSNGFVFKDNNGNKEAEMQGTATLLADMTIGENEELTIPEGKSLTIGENVTLTNDKGTITNNGTITNEGTITNNGTIKNAGKINGEVSGGGSLLTKLKEEMIEIEPVSYTYTGTAVEPTVTVKSSDNTDYTQGADYTLDCANNTDAGTATVKVIPTNQTNGKLYGEAVSMTFTITPKALTDNMATLSSTAYTYDGNKPTISVKDGDASLTESTDYTVTWPDNAAGAGTHTVTITGQGNYTSSIEKSYTINSRPYIPPTPDPDPVYYTVTIPTEVTGAIIHDGGTHEVEEYTYCSLRIELDPNGSGEYPTVTKGYWWDTVTPDGQGNYSFRVTGDTQITIGEVPTHAYHTYQLAFPTDSVVEADDQYWSGDYIEVTGASPLRAAEEAVARYQAPFGTTVTLRPIETERRKFLMWEDGSKQKNRTLTFRADQEIKALCKRISPTGIEAIAAGSVIRGERGQLYIEVHEACDVTLYTYSGVPVRVARLAAGANRLSNLNAGLYLVKIGGAPAVPVRIR